MQELLAELDWAAAISAGLRITLALLAAFVAVRLIRALMSRVEQRIVRRSRAGGEESTEASKRAETLTRFLRQGAVIVIWTVAILVILREIGVDDFADSAVKIKGRLRTRPIKQWEVGREFRRRLKMAFDQAGVEIPVPQRSLSLHAADRPGLRELVRAAGD